MFAKRSPGIIAVIVTLAFFALTAGVAAQNTTTYTVYVYVYGTPCVGEALTLQSYVYPTPPTKNVQWFIEAPDGAKTSGTQEQHYLRLEATGTYHVMLIVSDGDGAKLGSNRTDVVSSSCQTTTEPTPTTSTTEPHRDCYDERTGTMYNCDYPPTASPSCVKYRDESGNVYEKCGEQTTTSPYDASLCQGLSEEQHAFYRQWKYEYYAYYEKSGSEAGSDLEFENEMRQRQESFIHDWQSRWSANGCDRPYAYANPECGWYWDQAQYEILGVKERYGSLWRDHYQEMDDARNQWASYSEENRQSLESRWRQYAADLTAKNDAEMRAIADRYKLWECGYHAASSNPNVTAPAFSGRLHPVSAYDSLRATCDARIAGVKEIYIEEFRSLRTKLEQTSPSSGAYEALRLRLSDLERKVAAEIEGILAECRSGYRTEYAAPQNFRDGMGSLHCYYDDAMGKIQCRGSYVSFVGDPRSQFLSRFTCGGQPVFDDLYANRFFENFEVVEDQDAASLLIRSENLKLIFHDGPRGVINLGAVGDAELYLVPSPYLTVEAAGNGLSLNAKDGWTSALVGQGSAPGGVSYDAIRGIITVRGEATWIAESCRPDGSDPDGDLGSRYYDAIKARRLGAQVTISLDSHDKEDYADMDVAVERQGGRKFLAVIDSDEGTCKTVVLRFDQGIFETIKLNVVMTDENGDPIAVKEASNLEDVLDPCDDGDEGFEFWIVQDRRGTQVLVSFAHFSEKRVSVEAASVGNVVVPGFDGVTAALAIGLVAVASLVVRRRLTP